MSTFSDKGLAIGSVISRAEQGVRLLLDLQRRSDLPHSHIKSSPAITHIGIVRAFLSAKAVCGSETMGLKD